MNLREREKEFLKMLIRQKSYQSAQYFTEKLQVSTKTIYKDLVNIQEFLAPYQMSIEKIPRKGIRLVGNDESRGKLKLMLGEIVTSHDAYDGQYRRLFIFAEMLFSNDYCSYQAYADYFFISTQTIKKDIDLIEDYLTERQLVLQRVSPGLSVNGDEAGIQLAFKDYLEKYQATNSLSNEQEIELFNEGIITIVEQFITSLQEGNFPNAYIIHSLRNELLILINRVKIGHHHRENTNLLFSDMENMQMYMTAIALSEQCSREMNIIFSKSDIYYLCSFLVAHGIEPNFQESNETITDGVKKLIARMSLLIDVDLSHDERLFNSLSAHISPMIFRLQIGVEIKNPLKEQIIAQYSTMFTLVKYGVAVIEDIFEIKLTDDEISFLTIHFQLAFEKIRSAKHILIVCPTGLGTSQLIYQRIRQNLPTVNIIEVVDYQEYQEKTLKDVDLIITAIKLSDTQGIPVAYVSALPTYEEINAIIKQLSQIVAKEKSFKTKAIYSTSYSISTVLDPQLIFLNLTLASQAEVLLFLNQQFHLIGYVTEAFKEAIFEREKLGSTGLSTGVAIPHASPETVLATKAAIITLKKPIKWGETEIRLVVLLAISEEDMPVAKNMLASIYNILSSQAKIQQLIACESATEIIQILRSERNDNYD